MRIFLVLSRWSKILQQRAFSTFQTMLLLVTVDAASLLFALVFLKCRSNINMFQVKKFSLMNICTAGPTKAPVKKSQESCSKKDHNNKVQRCTCSNGENMGSAWLHSKFVSPPIAMSSKSFRRSKAFFAITFFWFSKASGMFL